MKWHSLAAILWKLRAQTDSGSEDKFMKVEIEYCGQ